jgi:hypothetical protein
MRLPISMRVMSDGDGFCVAVQVLISSSSIVGVIGGHNGVPLRVCHNGVPLRVSC